MNRLTSAERVKRRRDKMRTAGLRPVQIWVPDTRAAGFTAECRRQSELIAKAENTDAGRTEAEFWERVSADAWDDLD
jgi:antidote-toxin recognition MazE-like antitoxin